MRKIFILLFVVLLVGCGITYPTGYDKDTYENTREAVRIMKQYNGGDLEKDITKSQLLTISNKLNKIESKENNWKKSVVRVNIIEFIYKMEKDGDTEIIVEKIEGSLND